MKIILSILFLVSIFFLTSCVSGKYSAFDTIGQMKATGRLKAMNAKDYFDSQLQIGLAEAVERGDTNQMQSLIDMGADVNYLGRDEMRPLFWALAKQNIRGFTFLLDRGANPNVVTENQPLESALDIAARMDDSEYLEQLLKHEANPNATLGDTPQAQHTAIFSATYQDKTNNIAILLRYGAAIDWKLSDGTTPFHDAIYSRSYVAALFLYHTGANPFIKNNLGYTSVETMKQFGDNGVLSRADERAYKQLLEEFRQKGLIDKP